MDRGQADALVGELARQLGIAGLALDGHGTCTLAIDEGAVIVTLGHNKAAGALDLMTCLDEVVPSGAQLVRLLSANFGWTATGGATFALEPGSGALVLQRRCLDQEVRDGGLRPALEGLVATAEAWTKRLATMADGEAEAEGGFDPNRMAFGAMRA